MHDCDVWIDYIPKFIEETKTKTETKMKTEIAKVRTSPFKFYNLYKRQKEKSIILNLFIFGNENKKK